MAKTSNKAKEQITKDMTFGEALEKCPAAAEIMMKYGLHCVGCHVASSESIEQGAYGHGLSDEDITKMVKEINDKLKQKGD